MSRLKGVSGARRRAQARPAILDRLATAAIAETVDAVHADGIANINAMFKRRSGRLRRLYRRKMRAKQKTGQVGYVTPYARRKAFYGRFLHDGTRDLPARPFHDMAVATHEVAHRKRMLRAHRLTLGGRGR